MGEHKTNHRKKRAIEQGRQVWYNCLKERAVLGPIVDRLELIAMTAGKYGYGKLSQPVARTDQARNWLTKKFMETTAEGGRKPMETDVLIMLDNDHYHHPYTLPRLVAGITDRAGERGVVGALYVRRKAPYDPLVFVRQDDGKLYSIKPSGDGLVRCDILGHGAIAIARWVFEDLEAAGWHYPYWRYTYDDNQDVMPSEDMYFGRICEETGISMWCDAGLEAPHFTGRYVTMQDTDAYLAAHPEIRARSVGEAVEMATQLEVVC